MDILIGTHRLLSKDVAFRDLGLLVVDEEQRFGVRRKERLKQLPHAPWTASRSPPPPSRAPCRWASPGSGTCRVIDTPPEDRLAIHT